VRFKKAVGDKEPSEAKVKDPHSLRAKYGVDIIKNGFYCSDDPKAANKERDAFLFPFLKDLLNLSLSVTRWLLQLSLNSYFLLT